VTTLVLTTAFARAAPVMGAFLFARYLHLQGEQVLFAALDDNPSGLRDDIVASGVPSLSFNFAGWLGMRKRRKVQEYADANGVDVVMSDGLRPDIVAAGLRGLTRVSNVRGLLREHYALDYPRSVARLATWAQMSALKKLDGVFAISPEIAEHLVGLGIDRDRMCVVDNFIDVAAVTSAGFPGPGQAVIPLGSGVHIGLFGALIRRKRIDIALRGFASAIDASEGTNVTLHIFGEGPLRSQLVRLTDQLGISRQVVFHGFLAQPLPLMAQMDIVLLTSDYEGVPRSLMEAMALGKTCVSSAFPGVTSIIKNDKTGYTFEPGSHAQLAVILTNLMSGVRIPPENLRSYMLERHDVGSCAPEMWDQIQQIAQSRRRVG